MLDFVINGGKRKITKPIFIKGYSKENDRLIELESINHRLRLNYEKLKGFGDFKVEKYWESIVEVFRFFKTIE